MKNTICKDGPDSTNPLIDGNEHAPAIEFFCQICCMIDRKKETMI